MKDKRNSIYLIIMYFLIFAILFFVFWNNKISPMKEYEYTNTITIETSKIIISQKQEKYWNPIYLKIPKINIDVNIEDVGITSRWILDIPKNISSAWWFHLWPRPGEKWVAIIDWHFGYKNWIPSVFNNLHKLNTDDKLYIEDEKWFIHTFIVSKVKIYKQNDNTHEVFTSNDEKSYLNIITCHWVWDENKKSYPYRLVVFSEKEIN